MYFSIKIPINLVHFANVTDGQKGLRMFFTTSDPFPNYDLYMCGCWQALTFIKKGPWALGPWSWWRLNRITLSERSPNLARKLIFQAASEKLL